MRDVDLYAQIRGVKSPWKVTEVPESAPAHSSRTSGRETLGSPRRGPVVGAYAASLLAAFLAVPVGADEVVALRDGSRQSGQLASCVAELCTVDGVAISRRDIVWIAFGGAAGPPAGDSDEDRVGFADGSVAAARIFGVNARSVVADSGYLDRSRIAWIRFAGPDVERHDLLVLRTGETWQGKLAGCVGETCTFEGTPVPRAGIAWLGLGVTEAPPAAVDDPTQGALQLHDTTMVPGNLVGIDAERVVTERGAYPRQDVVWAYLPPPQPDGPQPGQLGAPPPDPPPSPDLTDPGEETPPRQPGPTQQPPFAAGGGAPDGEAERGGLWSGRVDADYLDTANGGVARVVTTIDPVRLREIRYPLYILEGTGTRRVGSYLELEPEGSTFSQRFTVSAGGCTLGGAGTEVLGEEDVTASIWIKTADVDTTPTLGWNVPLGPGRYLVSIGHSASTYTVSGCGDSYEQGYMPVVLGRNVFPVPNDLDPVPRFLEAAGGRLAGSYAVQTEAGGTLTVSWSICREGTDCPPPPLPLEDPAKPPDDPCGDLSDQQGLLDAATEQRGLYQSQLDKAWKRFDAEWAEVQRHKGEYESVMKDCKLWGYAKVLMNLLAQTAGAPGAALAKLDSIVGGVQSGNPMWMLDADDPISNEMLKQLWDFVMETVAQAGESEIETLRRGLDKCIGNPFTLVESYGDARKFLDHYAEATAMFPRMRELLTLLFQKDLERWNQLNDLYQRCLQWAECKGLDPVTHCQQPPAPP